MTAQQAMEAIHVAYEYLKLVLEPGGAVALAAALNYSEVVKNKNVLVILSGGNIDKKIFLNSLKTKIKKLYFFKLKVFMGHLIKSKNFNF